jgi:hypothetical protein
MNINLIGNNFRTARNQLAQLFAELRNEGRELPPAAIELHESLVQSQRDQDEQVKKLEAELVALEAMRKDPLAQARRSFGPALGEMGRRFEHTGWEMHISPSIEINTATRKKVQEAGGVIRDARGDTSRRIVVIPFSLIELAKKLLLEQAKRVLEYKDSSIFVIVRTGMRNDMDVSTTVKKVLEGDRLEEGARLALSAAINTEIARVKKQLDSMKEGL